MKFTKYLLILLVSAALGTSTLAKDFAMPTLKQAENPTYDLNDIAGKKTYYNFMHDTLAEKIKKSSSGGGNNETVLKNGKGVSVKLNDENFNIHINFPDAVTGGRSYGWTSGQVGDWSDAMYLDNLAELGGESNAELSQFYTAVIQLVGASNPENLSELEYQGQRVATNFLAIYTAEQYRAIVDPRNVWDDALFEVTLLGAFHGGQSKFTKYYMGEFSTKSRKQASGVYSRGRPGPNFESAKEQDAEMKDYWQFSGNPDSNQSGINLTRPDFEKMGEAITRYYDESGADGADLKKVRSLVGGDKSNIIRAISKHFTTGQFKDAGKADGIAKAVATFMLDIHKDADKITAWIKKNTD